MPGKPPGSQQNLSTCPARASNGTKWLPTQIDRRKMTWRPGVTGISIRWR
jgi:hypothetical protein